MLFGVFFNVSNTLEEMYSHFLRSLIHPMSVQILIGILECERIKLFRLEIFSHVTNFILAPILLDKVRGFLFYICMSRYRKF